MKKLYIETLGCAMNLLDSEHMIAELREKENFSLTDDVKEADLILINTCSVREKPERKLFSEIGQFSKIKKEGAKIGVCGCSASHMGEEILKRAKSVSFVLGARNTSKITKIIHQDRAVEIDTSFDDSTYMFARDSQNNLKKMINISIGCDKSCTYCIVPYTRGEEISIPKNLILDEAKRARDLGAKEILLLGQNVNNYGRRFSDGSRGENFTALLRDISEIDGVERIRFVSPHPLHMDDEFIDEFAKNKKVCKFIHIPLQSGSNKILGMMKRGYSKEWFLDRVERIRERAEDVAFGTDIIVGFPGESEEDFEESMDVLERVRFEQLFSFVYSPRPHTGAINLKDIEIDSQIAKARLERLQNRHKEILDEISLKELGKIHEVYFESIDEEGYLEGRSDTNKNIKAKGSRDLVGEIESVKIVKTSRVKLFGEIV